MTDRDRNSTEGDEREPSPEDVELEQELDEWLRPVDTKTESPHDFVRRRMREIEKEQKDKPRQ